MTQILAPEREKRDGAAVACRHGARRFGRSRPVALPANVALHAAQRTKWFRLELISGPRQVTRQVPRQVQISSDLVAAPFLIAWLKYSEWRSKTTKTPSASELLLTPVSTESTTISET